MKLHRHVGISYHAAWKVKHKLMQVMMERDEKKLSGFIELDDAYLGGERTGCKPGCGAAGNPSLLRRPRPRKSVAQCG